MLTDVVSNINVGAVTSAAESLSPVMDVIRNTWAKETLLDIISGKVAVPDSVINEKIANSLDGSEKVKSMTITSRADGRLDIHADVKGIGPVELSGTIDQCIHQHNNSYVTYTIKQSKLEDHAVLSWIFSHISLAMTEKLVGKLDFGHSLPTTVNGNTITVNYDQALGETSLGGVEIMGYSLLDALEIKDAVPHDGYIEFTTALNVPEPARALLLQVLL